jgi:hypothetical protein
VISAEALCAGALAVLAAWPATGSTLALFELLLGAANAACARRRLLGILDPADELVAGQRCDVLPGIERRGVGDQRTPEVCWKLVHHPAGHSRGAHRATVSAERRDEHSTFTWLLEPMFERTGFSIESVEYSDDGFDARYVLRASSP